MKLAQFAALTVATSSTALVTLPAVAISFDLSTYSLVGRYNLPEPTRTVAPANNLLAQEVSAVTWNRDTNTLFMLGDGGTSIVQVGLTGQLINSMTLGLDASRPQGRAFYDPEGLAYVGNGRFVLAEERDRVVSLFTYAPNTTLNYADAQQVKLGTTIGNIGIEGITTDPLTGGFIAVKESGPLGVFQTTIDFAAGTASNGSATTVNSTNLFNPALAGVLDFADVFALSNLSTIDAAERGNLLLLSQESGRVVETDRAGNILSSLTIPLVSTSPLGSTVLTGAPGTTPVSVADQQHEGITVDDAGNLYITSENGGGDINFPQLWVFRPTGAVVPDPNPPVQPPTNPNPPTPTPASIIISEVAPYASGNTVYAADWFELTNTGTTAVDVTGWKMDDNSNSFASAVGLRNITSIAPGKSVVFIESNSAVNDNALNASFAAAWFGANVPAGLLIGNYGGAGVGLSTGGDAVNIFDGAGTLVTRVDFGPSTTGRTFDNTVGLNNVVITQLSTLGVNGAFNSVTPTTPIASGILDTGSPGVAVPEPSGIGATALGLFGLVWKRLSRRRAEHA